MNQTKDTIASDASQGSLPLSRAGDPLSSGDPLPGDDVAAGGPEPARIGRYIIRRRVGEGGMGVVYEAHDPELERAVAVKLVRPRAAAEAATAFQRRLLREGKAMARLSHPNVVAVHDVGVVGDAVFVAMELVEGPTLKTWLKDKDCRRPEARRAVIELFIAAGRGLAAAHAEGLVHRDFKPSNVLIDRDGRPRIADFGLVRVPTRDDEGSAAASALPTNGDETLTRAGAVLGTPIYMSPEQHRGAAVDARSDQFSFCVALWEALYGQHPYPGDTTDAIVANVRDGADPPSAPRAGLPRRARVTLLRGLARDPGARWPGMDPLLRALTRRPAGALTWIAAGASVATAAALAASAAADGPACDDGARRFSTVWSDARSADLARALEEGGVAELAAYPERVQPALEAYATSWASVYDTGCEEHAAGTRSDELREFQLRCLEARRVDFDSTLDLLAEAKRGLTASAQSILAGLVPPATCAINQILEIRFTTPDNPARAAEIEQLRARVDVHYKRAQARDMSGARETIAALQPEVARLDDYELTMRFKRYELEVYDHLGERERSRAITQEILDQALLMGDDYLAAWGAVQLIWAPDRTNAEESEAFVSLAKPLIKRANLGGTDTDVLLEFYTLAAEKSRGRVALARHERLIERLRESPRVTPETRVEIMANIANHALVGGAPRLAAEWLEEAAAIGARTLGPRHHAMFEVYYQRAYVHVALAEFDTAMDIVSEGIAFADEVEPDSAWAASLLKPRALALEGMGQFEGAVRDLERADAIREKRGVNDDMLSFESHNSRAVILDRLGRHDEARAAVSSALERFPRVMKFQRRTAMLTLADIELHAGRIAEARALYVDGHAFWTEAISAESPMALYAENGIALCDLATGDTDAAIAGLERVLEKREDKEGAPPERALTLFSLGQALWSRESERARARALAERAAAEYEALGPGYDREREAVSTWLKEHPISG